jgi:hypothetical protein
MSKNEMWYISISSMAKVWMHFGNGPI